MKHARRTLPRVIAVRGRGARSRLATMVLTARSHPRHLVLFAVVAGLVAGPIGPGALACAVAGAVIVGGRPAPLVGAVVAMLGGAVAADLRLDALAGEQLATLHGRELAARAVVLEPVRTRSFGRRAARVRVLDGPASGRVVVARSGARVGWPPGPGPGVGTLLSLRGRVGPLEPGDRYQRRRGATATLHLSRVRATGRVRGGPAGALDAVRRRAERGLSSGLAPREGALLRGMVLGQDERIDETVREEFETSGLAHLLAVSGQNVLLLATLVLALATVAGLDLRARLAAALMLVLVYVPLAGGGPSIQRAGVMGAAGLLAALAGRPASRWYALGLAAAVTLALNPLAIGEPGWQLSFVAVIGLLAFGRPAAGFLRARGCPGPLADAAAITVVATLATAPLLAFHFERISLASLPANLAAAPAVAPVMWLGMGSAFVAQLAPALAEPINGLNAYLLAYVGWVAHAGAALPLASVDAPLRSPVLLAAAYAVMAGGGAAAVARSRGPASGPPAPSGRRRRRWVATIGAIALLALVAAAWRDTGSDRSPGELVVSFLDVGQGDATLVQRDATALLFDTGPPGGPILRRLEEAGVERLDVLVVTHAQADHEGATADVMRAHPPRLLVNGGAGADTVVQRRLPALARAARSQVMAARAGQVIAAGGMEVSVLWPRAAPPPEAEPNDHAVVAHLRLGDFDLLLPADAESNVIAGLAVPEVEALKVAHHGSADDGLPALLTRLRPRVAAIEVGRSNTYGHPTASTLAALRGVPDVVRTDRDGTVRLHVRGRGMVIERGAS